MRAGRPGRPGGRENTGRAGEGRKVEPGQDSAEGGMTFGKGHHLHLVDGSAFIFRAYMLCRR